VHDAYDAEAMHRFWLSLVSADRVFARFRAGFRGKASPVAAAHHDGQLGEFVLPYAEVRKAADPDGHLLEFLDSTFLAARDLAGRPPEQ
jgi:Family of unknown function (DUF5996)